MGQVFANYNYTYKNKYQKRMKISSKCFNLWESYCLGPDGPSICKFAIQTFKYKYTNANIIKMFQFVRMQPPGPDGPSICETGIGMFSFRQLQSGPQPLLSWVQRPRNRGRYGFFIKKNGMDILDKKIIFQCLPQPLLSWVPRPRNRGRYGLFF